MNKDEKGWDTELVAFIDMMQRELDKGTTKYGEEDTTLTFIQGIDPAFELGTAAKYLARIAHGDARPETDIIKVATYAYFYWKRRYYKE
jgi:hypothetical protein